MDGLTAFLDMLFVAIAALTILFANDYLQPRGLPIAEFAAVLIFAITGAMLIAGSADLLLLFVALELMVLPGYLLAGYARNDPYSTEGAIKYFLLGSFSSAILLFGLAYVWGLTGSTRVDVVAAALAQAAAKGSIAPGLAMGLAFMTAGVAFKMAAVPFHYWTPDAYQGSPTPVTAYLSVGPKIGAFAVALRLFVAALGPLKADWLPIVIVLAALTMTLGNLVAITQDNVKRMLAYSSIAHTGYILVGLAAYAGGQHSGISAILFYGAAYTFMNMGAFAVVTALQRRPGRHEPDLHVCRPGPARSVAGGADGALPAVTDRDPAARRLLGQGLRHRRGDPGRRLADGAGGPGDAQRGRGGVLLPARGRVHVHARTRRGCRAPVAGPALPGRPGRDRHRAPSSSGSSRRS